MSLVQTEQYQFTALLNCYRSWHKNYNASTHGQALHLQMPFSFGPKGKAFRLDVWTMALKLFKMYFFEGLTSLLGPALPSVG